MGSSPHYIVNWRRVLPACYFKISSLPVLRAHLSGIAGKYDNPDDLLEISHFQALSTALAATIGMGNIAGVVV